MQVETMLNSQEIVAHKRNTRELQTPGDVLTFWFEDVATDPSQLKSRNAFWWNGGDDVDRLIANRGVKLLARLASGLAHDWAAKGGAERLAAIIALDQFTRNIFRDTPYAFENDELALQLCKDGLDNGDDKLLAPIKRYFFYMPLEHSENLDDQNRCVALFEELLEDTDDSYKETIQAALDYAIAHRDIIAEYGRFPHRNAVLERENTPEEAEYLKKPGAGF